MINLPQGPFTLSESEKDQRTIRNDQSISGKPEWILTPQFIFLFDHCASMFRSQCPNRGWLPSYLGSPTAFDVIFQEFGEMSFWLNMPANTAKGLLTAQENPISL